MTTLGKCSPQELPVNHTVCNKTNVEIQILYLECQWKPHKALSSVIELSLKYCKF